MDNEFDAGTYSGSLDRTEYWVCHLESWLAQDVLFVGYEELMTDYAGVLARISGFVGEPLGGAIRDVRRERVPRVRVLFERMMSVVAPRWVGLSGLSSVHYRKGTTGDWRNHFTSDDEKLFFDRAQALYDRSDLSLIR